MLCRGLALSVLALSLSKCRRVPKGWPGVRAQVRLQRACATRPIENTGDASTLLRMTCIATNANPWQPGFRYRGQTRTLSPIESTFRTSSPGIPRFLDCSGMQRKQNALDSGIDGSHEVRGQDALAPYNGGSCRDRVQISFGRTAPISNMEQFGSDDFGQV